MKRISCLIVTMMTALLTMAQGWPENYNGVMLQGFYWDSFNDTRWVTLEKQAADLAGSFDLVWIPQSGNCGGQSMGYDDLWWFNDYNSSFGNEQQLRSMIQTFKGLGIGTIADVVINHRRNVSNWVDFPKETWNGETYEMLSTDIVSNDDGGKTKTWATDNGYSLSTNTDTGEGWEGIRDIDHKSENVQRIVKAYLNFLLSDLGYTGFRYDMVKGYNASYTKMYNEDSKPQFSVGECWDSSNTIRKWIDGTEKTSAAFDFQFRYTVRNACNNGDWTYLNRQNDGNWPLVSNNYDSGAYRQYAVTFVENHDTEWRSSSAPQDPIKKDTLAANAFLLAMPGTPCVFLKHWQAYRPEIKAMIQARKVAGINNMSGYENLASDKKYFANSIDGKLVVVVGDEKQFTPEGQWTKVLSGYHYAYYLANSLQTPWVDKAACTFSEPFDVTLTAVTDRANAKLVYTTDGSEPSLTNGTEAANGTAIRISTTTTLTVALIDGDNVVSGLTNTYTYQETETGPEVTIPDFCQIADGEICAFFEAPVDWTNDIHCWAWTDSPSDNFTGGNWPGVACEFIGEASNGNKVWKWTWDGSKQKNSSATMPAMIIFNNAGQPQTKDLTFTQGGYYDKEGLVGTVTPTAIRSITTQPDDVTTKAYTLDGRLVCDDGKTESLPKGIYIINGKKRIVR